MTALREDLSRYVASLTDRLTDRGGEGQKWWRRVLRGAETPKQAARNATKAIHGELNSMVRKHREREEALQARGINRDDLVVVDGGKRS